MCDICIAGVHFSYGAIVPIILILLQWIVSQLSNAGVTLPSFITKRIQSAHNTSPEEVGKKTQQHQLGDVCNDIWCLCTRRFHNRKRSSIGGVSHTPSESSLSDNEEDDISSQGGYEQIIINLPQHMEDIIPIRRQSKKTKGNDFPSGDDIQFIDGEFCMPCQ